MRVGAEHLSCRSQLRRSIERPGQSDRPAPQGSPPQSWPGVGTAYSAPHHFGLPPPHCDISDGRAPVIHLAGGRQRFGRVGAGRPPALGSWCRAHPAKWFSSAARTTRPPLGTCEPSRDPGDREIAGDCPASYRMRCHCTPSRRPSGRPAVRVNPTRAVVVDVTWWPSTVKDRRPQP